MIEAMNSKYGINLDLVDVVILSDSNCILKSGSKTLFLPISEKPKLPKNFIEFTDRIIVNKNSVFYFKNNFEQDKRNKIKVSVILKDGEYYRIFDKLEDAEIFFSNLVNKF